ncbi:MAG TPA: EfeM/EfeO family lipoprotein [Chloroflexia bacterium]|nr:EfeM/EfeO family lipoprotein [Chloroflexia bacterium]
MSLNLQATIKALQNNQIEEAKLSFQKFNNRWFDVLVTIRVYSKDSFRQIEEDLSEVERLLLRTDNPVSGEILPKVTSLQKEFNNVIARVSTTNPNGASSASSSPLTSAEVETLSAKIREYLREKTDSVVKTSQQLQAVIKSRDMEKTKVSYEAARYQFEQVEFLVQAFKDFNIALDGRPEDMVLGENDPHWTGFHPLEKAIYQDGRLDDHTDQLATQLVEDAKAFQAEIDVRKLMIGPASALNGAASLIEEILVNKITGEEERYSHTDLNDFRANLSSARQLYEMFKPYVQKKNLVLDTEIQDRFNAVEKSISPFFDYNSRPINYNLVDTSTRRDLAQKVENLADSFSRLPGTLGLKN